MLQSLRAIVLQFTDKEFQKICIGVIDLIFFYQKKYYILDWKTNWLGERAEDYHSENLFGAMLHHNYFLQYFLYYLALIFGHKKFFLWNWRGILPFYQRVKFRKSEIRSYFDKRTNDTVGWILFIVFFHIVLRQNRLLISDFRNLTL